MAALTSRDAERMFLFVADAESLGGDDPFTSALLSEFSHLVPADRVLFHELDRVRRRNLLQIRWPAGENPKIEPDDEPVWRFFLEEHPLCVRQQEGYVGAIKLSDFLTQRELHRTWAYDFEFAPFDIEYQLEVSIPSPLWPTNTLLFNH